MLSTKGAMNIHVIPRRLHLSDPICDFAAETIGHLESINHAILGAAVVLSRETSSRRGSRYCARVKLNLPGRSVHAAEAASDLYSALDVVQSKLARQLRKRKTRFNDRRTHKLQRRRERLKNYGSTT